MSTPFRKMRRIFSCWEFPKPLCVLSLNIPFEKRHLLHFAPHYIQHADFHFCQSFERVFSKSFFPYKYGGFSKIPNVGKRKTPQSVYLTYN